MSFDVESFVEGNPVRRAVLLKGKRIVAIHETDTPQEWWAPNSELTYSEGGTYTSRSSLEVDPGAYTLAIFSIGHVGGGYLAVDHIHFFQADFESSVVLPVEYKNLIKMFKETDNISNEQRKELVSYIKLKSSHWWENATSDVKRKLN